MEIFGKYYYSSNEFDNDCHLCIKEYFDSGFDAIISPYRGGLPFGVKLSHILDLPLGVIEFQRLDGNVENPTFNLAISPIRREQNNKITQFVFMKKILLVDDICDSGKTIEKIYRYLKLVNPEFEIEIITLFGSLESRKYLEENIPNFDSKCYQYINEIPEEAKWIVFPWEDHTGNNTCNTCNNGEPCYNKPLTHTHCSIEDKSFVNEYKCSEYNFRFPLKKFYKKE